MTTAQSNRELRSHMRYLRKAMAAGLIPPHTALYRPRYCGCGEKVQGSTHGITRREYGDQVLWQARCSCGSDLTMLHTNYRREA